MYSSCYISLTKFIPGKLVGSFLLVALGDFRTEFILLIAAVYFSWRHRGPIVSMLDSRSCGLGSSMGWGYRVLFFLFLFFTELFFFGGSLVKRSIQRG